MNLKEALTAFVRAVSDEADRNPEFRARIESALSEDHPSSVGAEGGQVKRKGGRRTPAVLDPVELARHGENALRMQLAPLDIEKLRDIVAQYGMDPSKLVMKWKNLDRVVDHIVQVALTRATKGDAFRGG